MRNTTLWKRSAISTALLTCAVLVLPALAQTYERTGTSAAAAETDGTMDAGVLSATGADVGSDTAEDTGTGTTIPRELPETGGGWGARLR